MAQYPEELELYCLENESFSFIAHELYTALGTENIRSKYFHLFAIIESDSFFKRLQNISSIEIEADPNTVFIFLPKKNFIIKLLPIK